MLTIEMAANQKNNKIRYGQTKKILYNTIFDRAILNKKFKIIAVKNLILKKK
jgi:hypothetical protein